MGSLTTSLKLLHILAPFYVQVGDAEKDHGCWERPEDMDTPRNLLKIDKNTPGTEVAAETAAALAVASLVFRKCEPIYSKIISTKAIRVFEFADKHRGVYSVGLKPYVCPYYFYSGYQDELLWGAAWLHKATKNPTYLTYIQTNGQTRPLELMNLTTHLYGTTSMLEQEFSSPRLPLFPLPFSLFTWERCRLSEPQPHE